MAHSITTVASRSKLKPRREPYWHRISKGFYLGFRKSNTGANGSWIIRTMQDGHNGKSYQALGDFAHLQPSERFDAALKEASRRMHHIEKGGSSEAMTVADACQAYVEHLRRTKTERAASDAERRFAGYVLDDRRFAAMELTKLTPAHIDQWRNRLADRPTTSGGQRGGSRTASTLNRDMTPFRAALNHAFESGWVTTDFAWRGKLKPLANADKKRELYLDREQRISLFRHASDDLSLFLRVLSNIPVRPGALANLRVKDFDVRLRVLKLKDKTGLRAITLPQDVADLLSRASRDKLPEAPLLSRADGLAWNKDSWKYPVKEAAARAGLPNETTAYTIRHSVITDLVHAGLDLLTIAQISGTSVRMIEKHYGHFRADKALQALESIAV